MMTMGTTYIHIYDYNISYDLLMRDNKGVIILAGGSHDNDNNVSTRMYVMRWTRVVHDLDGCSSLNCR